MTSQTLVSNSSVDAASQSNVAVLTPAAPRLPYSKPQQIELLHLQAEADALLQQLQILKQQKQLATVGQ
ncbi:MULTISPECIES: hypothetical protein [unclassified Leptolyngbya]|uniref:hypothetical protein n=1 Tax=unclassified Leptolyngbya TaxID=2650499 RepID=UPI001683262A|nr:MULTISPECIES: hypothetical protein [unclassified Leptolyngbya]MBD1911986.1 hypothetical protein [Leptolyngbya sp. FACHB-8]MBD2155356.1 hypothetical protein [Leptolyngbya sp. FACHB-16]